MIVQLIGTDAFGAGYRPIGSEGACRVSDQKVRAEPQQLHTPIVITICTHCSSVKLRKIELALQSTRSEPPGSTRGREAPLELAIGAISEVWEL